MRQLRLVTDNDLSDPPVQPGKPESATSKPVVSGRAMSAPTSVSSHPMNAHPHASPSAHEPKDTLQFPTAAVHVLNRQRIGRLTTPVSGNQFSGLRSLEASINKHLDRAQSLVNQLHQEVDSFRFPTPEAGTSGPSDPDRPRAA